MDQLTLGSEGVYVSIFKRYRWLVGLGTLVFILLLAGYFYLPRAPVNLALQDNLSHSGLYSRWAAGEVIVLVRHGERCDSSVNECLGPSAGITVVGSSISSAVGQGFTQLGMGRTDVFASPATRTVQTAESMFGQPVVAERWLHDCNETLIDQALARKKDKRNMILVTHSGCISEVEALHGYPSAPKSKYASALFIAVDSHGNATLRGILNPEDWPKIADRKK
nr:histidine phosphatase family protein [uncultured Pseudomonas sp.]